MAPKGGSSTVSIQTLPRSITSHSVVLMDDTVLARGHTLLTALASETAFGLKVARDLIMVCGDRPVPPALACLARAYHPPTGQPAPQLSCLDLHSIAWGWEGVKGSNDSSNGVVEHMCTFQGYPEVTVPVASACVTGPPGSTLSLPAGLCRAVLQQATCPDKSHVVFIDCLSMLMIHHGVSWVYQFLRTLSQSPQVHTVYALVHGDMHSDVDLRKLTYNVKYRLTVTPALESSHDTHPRYKLFMYKSSGRIAHEKGYFTCSGSTGRVHAAPRDDDVKKTSKGMAEVLADGRQESLDPASNLTFDLTLTAEQRSAKNKVNLSWQHTGEHGGDQGQSTAESQGAVIIVGPEDSDIDSDDPDDDLDI